MRSVVALTTIAVVLTTIAGCASSDEIRLRMRVAELEQHLANAQDDNAALQMYAIGLTDEIRAWQRGAEWQAREMARIRETCEL